MSIDPNESHCPILTIIVLVLSAALLAMVLTLCAALLQDARASADDDTVAYRHIAGVLIGEGGTLGEDYEMMACVVRNRLQRGWSVRNVLAHFAAPYHEPTQAHLEALTKVLSAQDAELSKTCRVVYFFIVITIPIGI